MRFKEMFHQSASDGIPSHWVVFYYIDDNQNSSHEAAYFDSEEAAKKFIKYNLKQQEID